MLGQPIRRISGCLLTTDFSLILESLPICRPLGFPLLRSGILPRPFLLTKEVAVQDVDALLLPLTEIIDR